MFDILNKLGPLKKKMEEIKARLETIYIEESDANGQVKIKMSASRKVKDIYIDDRLCSPDHKEELRELLETTLNRALEKAENVYETEMKAMGKDLLPGFPGMG